MAPEAVRDRDQTDQSEVSTCRRRFPCWQLGADFGVAGGPGRGFGGRRLQLEGPCVPSVNTGSCTLTDSDRRPCTDPDACVGLLNTGQLSLYDSEAARSGGQFF